MKEMMIRTYLKHTAAHKYLVGFEQDGNIYYTVYAGMIADELLKMDRASSKKGGMLKIRVRLSAKIKRILTNSGKAVLIGSAALLNTDDSYNKGERFERLITERLTNTVWHKDRIPFWQAGDICWNGEQVQIKFDGAELTNEKVLARAEALAA